MSWKEVEIGDLVQLQRGHDLTDSQRKEGVIPVIGSAGPNGTHNIAKQTGPSFTVGRSGGSIGKVTFVPSDYWPHNTCLYARDLKGNNPRFLAYFLSIQNLASLNSGAAQPSLNRNFVHSQKVLAPDVETQERIAAILSAYDDLIENNRRRIALLEQAARLLYREWFVHFRFPGHGTANFVDGLPEGWERTTIDQLLVLQRGFDLPVSNRKDGRIPIYGSTGIVGYHDTPKVSAPVITTGRSGSLGQVSISSVDCWPLNTSLWVKELKGISPLYAYFFLQQFDLKNYGGGASVPTLDRKVVHGQPTVRPSDEVIKNFECFAVPQFEMIQKLQNQSAQLTKARDLLLPRLMDGRIPV